MLLIALIGLVGTGLAAPYLLVAFSPAIARLIPKPGTWIGWIKPVFGVGLLFTLGYLIAIASRQLQLAAVCALMLGCAVALLGLRVGTIQGMTWARKLSLGLLLVCSLVLPIFTPPPNPNEINRDYRVEIDSLLDEGKRVFVDVTAFWCATCQTNKLWVLDRPEIVSLFEGTQTHVLTINADTMAENITTFMQEQGRMSLPLNILFSSANPDGDILPSVLTKNAVYEAINRTL